MPGFAVVVKSGKKRPDRVFPPIQSDVPAMSQNIYDDKDFFAGYATLPRSARGLDGAPEWPHLRRLLPNLDAADVIDLGCGYGWFSAYAAGMRAAHISAFDISEKMLAHAAKVNAAPTISYGRADLETLTLTADSADLVYSALAFHYIVDLKRLFGEIARALRPSGAFVFSVEHPMFTAPSAPQWMTDANGNTCWPINSYLDEGPRVTNWFAKGIVKQHRTLSTYVNLLISHGLTPTHLEEWGPSDAQLAAMPELGDERHRPTFLLMAAQKNL